MLPQIGMFFFPSLSRVHDGVVGLFTSAPHELSQIDALRQNNDNDDESSIFRSGVSF